MANQPRRGFFGRVFGRAPASNNSLTLGLKNAINRLNAATKNATTALTVNQVVAKMNNTKTNNGRSVTNIFKKAIANQFQKAHAAIVAAAAGRVPQTAAAKTVNYATANIKNIVTKLPANKYVNLNRVYNKNRSNYGNVVPNSNANKWWKNVNAILEARRVGTFPAAPKPPGGALLGGAGMGPGPLPPSGLPANVAQSNRGVFKKGNKPNNQGRNLWYPAALNRSTGQWNIIAPNAPHLKNNKGNFTPIGPAAV
jgi:hypothetical protein